MSKISVLIFSFDRPAQLHLLLESIKTYDVEQRFVVTVQYCYSSQDFLKGYTMVIDHFPGLAFVKETRYLKPVVINPFFGYPFFNIPVWAKHKRFRYAASDFRQLLINTISKSSSEYCMFLTDDSLFYRNIQVEEEILKLVSADPSAGYSLALGGNIKEEGSP
jgi:hypothetical protein